MRLRRTLAGILLLTATAVLWAVPRAPTSHPPLAGHPALVASFGEFRPDHLHPGVDLSTGGVTGLPVLAVAEGQIYRLKVEWRGYGRAIYLRHADGTISVYAHLERFDESVLKLESRVLEARRNTGSRYPGDIYLDPPVAVKRGQRIATSGESGAGLPHLHFELRLDDQRPGNPIASLGEIPGGAAPRIEALIFIARGADTLVRGGRSAEVALTRDRSGAYFPAVVPVVTGPFLPEARIAQENSLGHRIGIRGISVHIDGSQVYQYLLNEFRFDQYPQVGLLLDAERSSLSPPLFTYRLARLLGNELGRVGQSAESPWPELAPGRHVLELQATGAQGEVARAKVPFEVVAPPHLKWQEGLSRDAGVKRLALHLEPAGSAPLPRWRLVYHAVGSATPLECMHREPLPDGEACEFPLDAQVRGISATLSVGGDAIAMGTHLWAAVAGPPAAAPPVEANPGSGYMDLAIAVSPSERQLPARFVLHDEAGETRRDLVERQPGKLVASVPLEIWARAAGLELEWDAPEHPSRLAVPLQIHEATPEKALRVEDCGLRLDLPAAAVFESTPLACTPVAGIPPAVQGLELRGPIVRILPSGTSLAHKALLTFPHPADGERPRRLGIYRLDEARGEWNYLGGDAGASGVSVAIGRFDTFSLLEDASAPRILGWEPDWQHKTLEARPRFVVRVEDVGSGLNFDGVHLQVDGRELEMEFDPDRGHSTGTLAAPLSRGTHGLRLWAEDRAGNRSPVQDFEVRVP